MIELRIPVVRNIRNNFLRRLCMIVLFIPILAVITLYNCVVSFIKSVAVLSYSVDRFWNTCSTIENTELDDAYSLIRDLFELETDVGDSEVIDSLNIKHRKAIERAWDYDGT